jgi:hypothetical protein
VCPSARSLVRTNKASMQSFRKDQLASQIQIPGMWVSLGRARARTKNYTTAVSHSLAGTRTDVRVICLFTM